jgi:hypothetical protein
MAGRSPKQALGRRRRCLGFVGVRGETPVVQGAGAPQPSLGGLIGGRHGKRRGIVLAAAKRFRPAVALRSFDEQPGKPTLILGGVRTRSLPSSHRVEQRLWKGSGPLGLSFRGPLIVDSYNELRLWLCPISWLNGQYDRCRQRGKSLAIR